MASAATLSRRSVHPAAFESAPSAPAYPVYGSTSPLADCCPTKPAAAASYPPMTHAEVLPTAGAAPAPCPPSPFEAAPSAASCGFAPPNPTAGSFAIAHQPSATASYPSAAPFMAYGMPPPAPATQFTYAPPADDKVRPSGCFNCSPEVGAAIGTVIGGTLAVIGVVALEVLRWAIIFA